MKPRSLFFILAFLAAGFLAACGEPPEPDGEAAADPAPFAPPFAGEPSTVTPGVPAPGSVVIVMIDALRADRLGAYGSEDGLTPNLDALAEQSVVFDEAAPTSSWTRSSIASIFSGRYPISHTVLGREDLLPSRILTLAEVLQGHADTWNFGITTNPNSSESIGFGQGFDHYQRPRDGEPRSYPEDDIGLISAETVTRTALGLWDDERNEEGRAPFAFVHYMDPHDPYMPNPDLMNEPEPDGRFSGSRADLVRMREMPDAQRTEADEARLWHLYDGEVRYTDQWIGELIEGFKARGVFEDMLLIVTSDHGESFWEHGKRGHGQTLYRTLMHVPLMIKLPGMGPGDGRRVETPVSLVDLAPTVVDAMRLPRPRDFEGRSLLPLVQGGERDPALEYIYSELYLIERYTKTSIRHGDYKLIATYHKNEEGEYAATETELYNLAADPGEQENLADDDAHRERLNAMVAALIHWEDAVAERSLGASEGSLEELRPETLEELRGLGYIE